MYLSALMLACILLEIFVILLVKAPLEGCVLEYLICDPLIIFLIVLDQEGGMIGFYLVMLS